MDCDNPSYIVGIGFVRCNRCHSCKVNKKKEWADRLHIESRYWTNSYFISLTYDPEHMPKDLSLSKKDVFDWKKRLGYYFGKVPQLYYCGEYGSIGDLPHFHAVIFTNDDHWDDIMNSWDKGNVDIKHLTRGRCNYIAGYVVKKLDKEERTDGRTPEFYGASRRPPLGYRLLYELLERIATDDKFRERVMRNPYPPYSVKIGGDFVRLPPYIRNKLSPIWKLYNEETQEEFKAQKVAESRAILKAIKKNLQDLHRVDESERLIWNHLKMSMMDVIEERAKNKRRAYDIRNRRL